MSEAEVLKTRVYDLESLLGQVADKLEMTRHILDDTDTESACEIAYKRIEYIISEIDAVL